MEAKHRHYRPGAGVAAPKEVLEIQAAQLEEEVQLLRKRLSELHGTDVHHLRTAYNSIAQHVLALESEALMVAHLVDRIETDFFDPGGMAEEVATAGSIGGLLFMASRLAMHGPPLVQALQGRLLVLGGLYAAWRISALTFNHLRSMLHRNREVKAAMRKELGAVQQRINIMHDITKWSSEPALNSPAYMTHGLAVPHAQAAAPPSAAGRQQPLGREKGAAAVGLGIMEAIAQLVAGQGADKAEVADRQAEVGVPLPATHPAAHPVTPAKHPDAGAQAAVWHEDPRLLRQLMNVPAEQQATKPQEGLSKGQEGKSADVDVLDEKGDWTPSAPPLGNW